MCSTVRSLYPDVALDVVDDLLDGVPDR